MAYSKGEINEMFDAILKSIISGNSIRHSIKESGISSQTFYIWLDGDEDKSKRYARACEIRAENIFDEILTIADSQEGDVYELDGVEITNHDAINRARLRVDARKWVAAKLNPKKYGDKIQSDVTLHTEQPLFGS